MSPRIKILPPDLANKIAAGEVVGRPASVVKELMENSIDAQASSITVIIKEGGKSLIHVIDDGLGMSEEDAGVAFERHATSKIATYDDLENIRTLGFRGEALAATSAVAQVEMRTRQATSAVGAKVNIEGGNRPTIVPDAFSPGTSVMVKNLFYNTPGRRNFLKSNHTEFKHIFDVIQRVALSHPSISLKFVSDEDTILQLQPAGLVERVKDIFGEKLSQTVFQFENASPQLMVHGLLGKPDFARKSRTEQYLYLNNRYIVSRSINHAVFQAYENLLEKGSFPFFILFLTVDPHVVDVNVHPSKMEVKFEDESSVYRFILSSVRKALSEHDLVPAVTAKQGLAGERNLGLRFQHGSESTQRVVTWRELINGGASELPAPAGESATLRTIPGTADQDARGEGIQASGIAMARMWQLHNKYIILPVDEGLLLIDQHAAHERVIYERTLKRFGASRSASQQLLFPLTSEMTPGDAALVLQLQSLLSEIGFSLKFFGKSTVIVDGVPLEAKAGQEGTILQDLLDLYKEDDHNLTLEPREKLAKSFSCRAAIKAGDPMNQAEMQSLLDQLFETEVPYVCPHGRPVIVKLSLSELDRRFGRSS